MTLANRPCSNFLISCVKRETSQFCHTVITLANPSPRLFLKFGSNDDHSIRSYYHDNGYPFVSLSVDCPRSNSISGLVATVNLKKVFLRKKGTGTVNAASLALSWWFMKMALKCGWHFNTSLDSHVI